MSECLNSPNWQDCTDLPTKQREKADFCRLLHFQMMSIPDLEKSLDTLNAWPADPNHKDRKVLSLCQNRVLSTNDSFFGSHQSLLNKIIFYLSRTFAIFVRYLTKKIIHRMFRNSICSIPEIEARIHVWFCFLKRPCSNSTFKVCFSISQSTLKLIS